MKVCLSTPSKTGQAVRRRSNHKSHKSIRQLTHSDSESDGDYIYAVKTNAKRRPYTRIKVLGYPFTVMVETGAYINAMDKESFAKLPAITLERTTTRAFAYNNIKPVTFIGKFDELAETKKRYAVATSQMLKIQLITCHDFQLWKAFLSKKR